MEKKYTNTATRNHIVCALCFALLISYSITNNWPRGRLGNPQSEFNGPVKRVCIARKNAKRLKGDGSHGQRGEFCTQLTCSLKGDNGFGKLDKEDYRISSIFLILYGENI